MFAGSGPSTDKFDVIILGVCPDTLAGNKTTINNIATTNGCNL
jgi:hypothetical protein